MGQLEEIVLVVEDTEAGPGVDEVEVEAEVATLDINLQTTQISSCRHITVWLIFSTR